MTLLAHRGSAARATDPCAPVVRLLGLSALAMVLTHWLRLLPLGFEAPGQTRYEDFADLLTPYVVAGPALAALARVGATRRTWLLALTGAAAFVQGHGLHLSANSIAHARGPAAPVELWDERVGHWIWFVGLSVLVAAVAHAVPLHGALPGWRAVALTGLVALTWAANVVEAGITPLGSALAVGLVALGWRQRSGLTGRLLVAAFGLSLVLVAAWGVWQGGWPQPSELGWLSRPLTRG